MLGSAAYNGSIFTSGDLIRELEHIMPKNHLLDCYGSMSWEVGAVRALDKFAEAIINGRLLLRRLRLNTRLITTIQLDWLLWLKQWLTA